jgi:hypothetical protein
MAILIYILVIIGALFIIASGVWVALTLAKVVSKKQITSNQKSED